MTAAKRGRGRPSLGGAARSELVTVKLSIAELAQIRSIVASDVSGRETVASWIRDRLLESLGVDDPR